MDIYSARVDLVFQITELTRICAGKKIKFPIIPNITDLGRQEGPTYRSLAVT